MYGQGLLQPEAIVPSAKPSFFGYLATTYDALVLLEACLSGLVQPLARRPPENERESLTRSGYVFIYDETSGMTRWTDGRKWSPSRMQGNFLLYRETNPKPPSGHSRTNRASRGQNAVTRDTYPVARRMSVSTYPESYSPASSFHSSDGESAIRTAEMMGEVAPEASPAERQLFGSLLDSDTTDFKRDGLMKKAFSVRVDDKLYSLISYYLPQDVDNLCRPVCYEELRRVQPRQELLQNQRLRNPLEAQDSYSAHNDVLLTQHYRTRHGHVTSYASTQPYPPADLNVPIGGPHPTQMQQGLSPPLGEMMYSGPQQDMGSSSSQEAMFGSDNFSAYNNAAAAMAFPPAHALNTAFHTYHPPMIHHGAVIPSQAQTYHEPALYQSPRGHPMYHPQQGVYMAGYHGHGPAGGSPSMLEPYPNTGTSHSGSAAMRQAQGRPTVSDRNGGYGASGGRGSYESGPARGSPSTRRLH